MKQYTSLTAAHKKELSFPHYVRLNNDSVAIIHDPKKPIDPQLQYEALSYTGMYRFSIKEHVSTTEAKGDWSAYGFIPACSEYKIQRH